MTSLILIVEDEILLASNIRKFLERRKFVVAVANNLRAAQALYHETQPDAILVDQNLPDGLGIDLIRKVRGSGNGTKLIMMTAHSKLEMAVDAMKAGADDYLVKPVALEKIAMTLQALLSECDEYQV